MGVGKEFFLGEQARRGERERAVGGRRRHQLLDRRANDRLYMQTPPAAGRRLFPPQITQFALFLSRCARISSLLFHYFVGDFGAAIFVSVKQKKKKKVSRATRMSSLRSGDQTLSETDSVVIAEKKANIWVLKQGLVDSCCPATDGVAADRGDDVIDRQPQRSGVKL